MEVQVCDVSMVPKVRSFFHKWVKLLIYHYFQNVVPRVRLELTTSACLTAKPGRARQDTDYKYGALTDCATRAHTDTPIVANGYIGTGANNFAAIMAMFCK